MGHKSHQELIASSETNLPDKQAKKATLAEDMRYNSVLISKSQTVADVTLEDFNLVKQIGKGGFGRVFLATLDGSDKKFAIKCIRKDKIIE